MSDEARLILSALKRDPSHANRADWEEFLALTACGRLTSSLAEASTQDQRRTALEEACESLLWIRNAEIENAPELCEVLAKQASLQHFSDPINPVIRAAQGRAAFEFKKTLASMSLETAWAGKNKKVTRALEQLIWDLDPIPDGPCNPHVTIILGQTQLPSLLRDPYRRELCYIQLARAHRKLRHRRKERDCLSLADKARYQQPIRLFNEPGPRFGL